MSEQEFICTCEFRRCNQHIRPDGSIGRILSDYKTRYKHRKDEDIFQKRQARDTRAKDAQIAQEHALRALEERLVVDMSGLTVDPTPTANASLSSDSRRTRSRKYLQILSEILNDAESLQLSLPVLPVIRHPSGEAQQRKFLWEVFEQMENWKTYRSHADDLQQRLDRIGKAIQTPSVKSVRDQAADAINKCFERIAQGERHWMGAQISLQEHLAQALPPDPARVFNTSSRFASFTWSIHPIIQLVLFMVVVLSVILKLPRRSCLWVLRMSSKVIEACLTFALGPNLSSHWANILSNFPKDVRTVTDQFHLMHAHTVYAVCPSCFYLHAPKPDENGSLSYPEICLNRTGSKTGRRCKELLLRSKAKDGGRILVPIKSFVSFELKDWIAELLSRPGFEQLMDGAWDRLDSDAPLMADIFDGKFLRQFKGCDGRLYGGRESSKQEGRYVVSLGFDFFNPLGNKQSGKSISIGVLVLACMNLPPGIRYKPENLFLAGIIPGPREPPISFIQQFFRPLVDQLLRFWWGIYFTQTILHHLGRMIKLALVLIVCDLRAARKCTCTGDAGCKYFCQRCWCNKDVVDDGSAKGLGNTDYDTWIFRTKEESRAYAEEWRDLPENQRPALFQRTGIRWSEFHRLPYFDLPSMLVVDPMHNLYLGLLMQHFRIILGYNPSKEDKDKHKKILRNSQLLPNGAAPSIFIIPEIPNRENNPLPPTRTALKSLGTLKKKLTELNGSELKDEEKLNEMGATLAKTAALPALTYLVKGLVPAANSEMAPKKKKTTRKELARKLLEWRRDQTETTQPALTALNVHGGVMSTEDTREVWRDIRNTQAPSWLTSVPTIDGASYGKLKADQWRVLGTLYLPMTLIRIWSKEGSADPTAKKHMDILHLTMHLVSAVIIASSRTADDKSIQSYHHHMTTYLTDLQRLFPLYKAHPNHHIAMHIHEFMELFGPAHSWWAFPWERMIGQLQRINTNYKEGDYESTIAFAHTEQINLRALITKENCPGAIKSCFQIFSDLVHPQVRDTLTTHIVSFSIGESQLEGDEDTYLPTRSTQHRKPLEFAYHPVFRAAQKSTKIKVASLSHLIVNGIRYTVQEKHQGNSQILLSGNRPAVINKIFRDEDNEIYILVQLHLPAEVTHDPFMEYPILRARLWSSSLEDTHTLIAAQDLGTQYAKCDIEWEGKDSSIIVSLARDFLENVEDKVGEYVESSTGFDAYMSEEE